MPNEIYHRSNWGESKAEDFGDVYYDHAATNKLYNHSDYYENSNGTDATLKDLNNKASIVLTPTAYSNGSLNTVIPPYQVLSELVTNGTFDTDSDWSKGAGWTISNGRATSDASANSYLNQQVYEIGKTYKLRFEVLEGIIELRSAQYSKGTGFYSTGTYSVEVIPTTTSTHFYVFTGFGQSSIDNVSVKEVQEADFDFSRGSSATRVNEQGLVEDVQILSGELVQNGNFEQIGSELVTNGDFDTDSDWSNSGSWSIGNGVATYDGLLNVKRMFQTVNFVQNKIYKISFNVTNTEDDYIDLFFGQDATALIGRTDYAVGSYEFYVTANSTSQNLSIYAYNTSYSGGSIDNVSVKEVGQNWTVTQSGSDTITIENGYALFNCPNNSNIFISQGGLLTVGKTYKASVDLLSIDSGSLQFAQGGGATISGSPSINTVGTHTFTFVAATATFAVKRKLGAPNLLNAKIDNISVIEITNDTDLPRIDFTDGTGSLLLEPQRTNTFVYSEDYSQTNWSKNQITASGNSIVSPDGSVNASLITISSSTPYLAQLQFLTTGTKYTISAFVKKGTNRWVRLAFVSSGVTAAWFDLENNVVGNQSANSVSASIENYGNGWYRIINTITAQQSSGLAFLGLSDANNGTSSASGIGNTVYVWGLQVTQGDYATSYIPTSGSTVTRSADVANNSGNADLFNDTEGVLYAEIAALANDGTNRAIAISDGTTSNVVRFYYSVTDNRIVGNVKSSGSNVFSFNNVLTDATDFIKVAVSYKANDFKMYVDGVQVSTDTSGAVPTGLVELAFDNGASADDFYGNTKAVAVFKEALTDEQLQKLTS